MTENYKRRLSLESDFMHFGTNDLLYGFMRGLSEAVEEDKTTHKFREYLSVKEFKKQKKVIAGICGCTMKTINNQIEKLFEVGLLDLGIETINGKEVEVYWFPFDPAGRYKLVDREIIKYLVYTRNAQAIRIYLYLLNKFLYKPNYHFTIKEIKLALGYAESTTSADEMISYLLTSFQKEGMIKYTNVTDKYKDQTINRYQLTYVCADKLNLPIYD